MFSAKDLLWAGRPSSPVLATGVALLAVTACLTVARLAGQELLVSAGARGLRPVPLGAALLATVVGGAAAYGLVRLAARSARPRGTFALLTGAGLLLSTVPPLQFATDVGTAVWLLVLHAVVAVAVLPPAAAGLPHRRSPRSPRSPERGSQAVLLERQEASR